MYNLKHIIIEGPNNIGKDTLIRNIIKIKSLDNIIIRHFIKPPDELNNKEKEMYQLSLFNREFHFKQLIKEHYKYFNLIWNRSYLGEWVYGYLWRNYEAKWIWEYENYINDENTYLILLLGTTDFVYNVNKVSKNFSYSEVQNFIYRFEEAFEKSKLKKIKIIVNQKDKFIDSNIILEKVKKFINI